MKWFFEKDAAKKVSLHIEDIHIVILVPVSLGWSERIT
jgi:hypothetical protein